LEDEIEKDNDHRGVALVCINPVGPAEAYRVDAKSSE
jgi:hypothetical protein